MITNLSPNAVENLETGHLPMLSDPDGVKQLLQAFVKRLSEGPPIPEVEITFAQLAGNKISFGDF